MVDMLRQVPTIADTDSTLLDPATDATVATALVGGVKMTADEWGESIVAPTKPPSPIISRTKTVKVEPGLAKPPSSPKKTLPEVMGWALAELTEEEEVEQQRFSKEIRARLDAERESDLVGSKHKAEDDKAEERNVKSCCSMAPPTKKPPLAPTKKPPVDPRTDHRRKPSYMTAPPSPEPKSEKFNLIPEHVFETITSVWNMQFLIEEAEIDDHYKYYLDGEINALNDLATDTKITDVDGLVKVYDGIRDYAKDILTRLDDLRGDDKIPMPKKRREWVADATELAQSLIEVLVEEKKVLSDEIAKQVFGDAGGVSDEE
jgi:hypothetical protein